MSPQQGQENKRQVEEDEDEDAEAFCTCRERCQPPAYLSLFETTVAYTRSAEAKRAYGNFQHALIRERHAGRRKGRRAYHDVGGILPGLSR